MRPLGPLGLAALVAAGGACSRAPAPPNPQLWTLFDVQALYAAQQPATTPIATDAGLPGGIPIGHLLGADHTLTVGPAWAEGYAVAYVTTEVWTNTDRVWLQPKYVPVTGWSAGTPQTVNGADGNPRPIFGVGAGSGFYSPFWQTIAFEVPPGTTTDAITTVRQIVDGGYPLHTADADVAPLAPADVTLASSMSVGGFNFGQGWVDGAQTSFVDFPVAPIVWDEAQVVEEIPLYYFLYQADDGGLVKLPIPTVLGTGPPYSHTPAPMAAPGTSVSPKYNAYWRIYTVVIPPGAVVFAPPGSDVASALATANVPVLDGSAYPLEEDDAIGRVALASACFATDPDPHDHEPMLSCIYLDSQATIEQYVNPGNIERTAITVTCPLVSVSGKAVGP